MKLETIRRINETHNLKSIAAILKMGEVEVEAIHERWLKGSKKGRFQAHLRKYLRRYRM